MPKMKSVLTALVFLALTALPLAAAQSQYDSLDTDGNGRLTREEFCKAWPDKNKCAEDFKWYDRNGDGFVTRAEFEGKM